MAQIERETRSVLIAGSGGPEHALAWRLFKNKGVERIYIAPGNGGTFRDNKPIDPTRNFKEFCDFARSRSCFVIAGSGSLQLTAESIAPEGLENICPSRDQLRLGSSRVFAKQFMIENQIKTPLFHVLDDSAKALDWLSANDDVPVFVSLEDPSGLSSKREYSSNAKESENVRKSIEEGHKPGTKILVEEGIRGKMRFTLFALCDGTRSVPFSTAIVSGDGLEAFSPVLNLNQNTIDDIMYRVVRPGGSQDPGKRLSRRGHSVD